MAEGGAVPEEACSPRAKENMLLKFCSHICFSIFKTHSLPFFCPSPLWLLVTCVVLNDQGQRCALRVVTNEQRVSETRGLSWTECHLCP